MQYCLLGPLRVADNVRTYTPSAQKLRKVIALLLLNADRLVPIATFLEELWDETPPPSALTTLQTYIYHLRKSLNNAPDLQDGGSFLVTRPAGYLARVRPGELDVPLFTDQVELARKAAQNDDPEQVSTILGQALMLWRGPVLVDVLKGPVLQASATFLEESRIAAIERRIEADLLLGRHAELVGELRALAATYPMREAFHAQLMLALSRAGRRSEALLVFHNLRRVLIEELGLEPSQDVQLLHQAVLSADSMLEPPAPRRITIWNGLNATPAQLPADIADFRGRRRELDRIERALCHQPSTEHHTVNIVAIVGTPGVGKSVLAVRAAHLIRSKAPDGQLYADLGGGSVDPCDVLGTFLRGLGVARNQIPDSVAERSQLYRTCIADRQLLVVLDGADSPAQIMPLLPGGASCAVLVTSRRPLRGLAGAEIIELAPMSEEEAVEMLAALVGSARLRAERDAVRTLVHLCDRLPLALRAAAGRLSAHSTMPVNRLVGRLDDPGTRLEELARSDYDVRAALEQSYLRLRHSARRALRLLSLVDTPGFGAVAHAAFLGIDRANADEIFEELRDAFLMDVVGLDEHGEPRYELPRLVRCLAREALAREEGPREIRAALQRAGRISGVPAPCQVSRIATAAAWDGAGEEPGSREPPAAGCSGTRVASTVGPGLGGSGSVGHGSVRHGSSTT